ncbi:MAG: hypothetical protein AB8H86_19520 [Polyangiales bacterium]
MWAGVALITLLVTIGVGVAWLQPDRKHKRRMRRFPLAATIADAATNTDVRVSGTLAYADGATPLTAPFSRRECVAWRVIVVAGEGKNWQEILREEEAVDFILQDESGRARVDGSFLTLALHHDVPNERRIFEPASPELLAFCEARGIETSRRSLRMHEGTLVLGEVVTVCGQGRFENDPNGEGYRGGKTVLRVGPLASGELLVTDDASLAK